MVRIHIFYNEKNIQYKQSSCIQEIIKWSVSGNRIWSHHMFYVKIRKSTFMNAAPWYHQLMRQNSYFTWRYLFKEDSIIYSTNWKHLEITFLSEKYNLLGVIYTWSWRSQIISIFHRENNGLWISSQGNWVCFKKCPISMAQDRSN